MGMYTEINMRASLKKDTPEDVLQVLECIVNSDRLLLGVPFPNHPLFGCDRWRNLGSHGSYYFPKGNQSRLVRPEYEWEVPCIALHGNLKNYDDEIAKFFDWLDPYIEDEDGTYLGYSLYEEDQHAGGSGPVLWRKGESVSVA